jgi:agmatinase
MKEPFNFGQLPDEYSNLESAKVVILPVAYDGTSTWNKGADKGPEAIIEASGNMELYDIETDSEVYKKGIFTDSIIKVDAPVSGVVEAINQEVRAYIEQGKFVVVVGGEHSVTIGAVKAHCHAYPPSTSSGQAGLTVLQLDAHTDLRQQYNNSKYNHACVMARVRELCPVVQVGIRSMDSAEKQFVNPDSIFFAKDIYNSKEWFARAVSKLSEKVYVTVDVDVFDPSIMPSTGTPEPGGLLWYDVLGFLRLVFEQRNVVGFDVVELCPDERNKAPDFMAAKLIYKLLSYKFKG